MDLSQTVSICPLCGSSNFRTFDTFYSSEIHLLLHYKVCTYCSLVFMSPRPDQESLNSYYLSTYREGRSGSEKPTNVEIDEQHARAKHLVRFFSKVVPETQIRSHLDIGCSVGELLLGFQTMFDITLSIGVEPTVAHRAYAIQQNSLQVFESLDFLEKTSQGPYDLVSLSHVLEHLPDPIDYLTRLRTIFMTEKSHLLVEVPNLYGHTCYELAHLYCFTPKTLEDVVNAAGFSIMAKKLHGLPRNSHLRSQRYITILAKVNNRTQRINRGSHWSLMKLRRVKGQSRKTWVQLCIAALHKPSYALHWFAKGLNKSR